MTAESYSLERDDLLGLVDTLAGIAAHAVETHGAECVGTLLGMTVTKLFTVVATDEDEFGMLMEYAIAAYDRISSDERDANGSDGYDARYDD